MVSIPLRRLARYLLEDGPTGNAGDVDGHRTLADPFVFAASAPEGPQTALKIEGTLNTRFKAGDQVFRAQELIGTIERNTDWDRKSPLVENTHLMLEEAYTVPSGGWKNLRLKVQPAIPADDATHGYFEVKPKDTEELATQPIRFEDSEAFRFQVSTNGGGPLKFKTKSDSRVVVSIKGVGGAKKVLEEVTPGETTEIFFSCDSPIDDPAAEFEINEVDVLIELIDGEGVFLQPLDNPANFHIRGGGIYKVNKPLHVKIRQEA